MAKRFRLAAAEIRTLAEGYGSCLATDHITVDGLPVGFMYREAPDGPSDSGWRFFSGKESQDYVDNARNIELYDVNTIANYDPSIIPFLKSSIGIAYNRGENGEFQPEPVPRNPDD